MEELPNKLSDLLALAVNDAQAFEKQPGCVLDMERWLEFGDDNCWACMAGAVMSQTLEMNAYDYDYHVLVPSDSLWHTNKLHAIDLLRCGSVFGAMAKIWGPDSFPKGWTRNQLIQLDRRVARMIHDAWSDELDRADWDTYLKVVEMLREAGL